jgi:cardiolipin synthase
MAFNLIYVGLIVAIIVVILLDNRNPVKTLAWVLILIFLPIVGIILYLFFGQNVRRVKILSRAGLREMQKHPMQAYLDKDQKNEYANRQELIHFFQSVNASYPFDDNVVDIYTQGDDMLLALLCELSKAKDHIHLATYIIDDDPVGRLIKDVLLDKAKEGVEIRVMYDDVGCWRVKQAFFEEMRNAGIEARAFMKVRFPLFTSKVNYRNHRKIIVIDGKVGFIGGMNLAWRYIRGMKWGIWRDTHTRIKGRAVYNLQSTFLIDWYFSDRSLITSSRYYPPVQEEGQVTTQIVTSQPVGEWQHIMQGLILAVAQAQKYFYIQTPYFLPSDTVLQVLQTAALAGIDVRIMLPQKGDNWLIDFASHSYIDDALRAGIKVYFYQPGFLHSKMMVSDDYLSTVGSTNMDFRSFEHNFEANAFMYDTATALELRRIYLTDLKHCKLLVRKEWGTRPFWHKCMESVLRLFAPLL